MKTPYILGIVFLFVVSIYFLEFSTKARRLNPAVELGRVQNKVTVIIKNKGEKDPFNRTVYRFYKGFKYRNANTSSILVVDHIPIKFEVIMVKEGTVEINVEKYENPTAEPPAVELVGIGLSRVPYAPKGCCPVCHSEERVTYTREEPEGFDPEAAARGYIKQMWKTVTSDEWIKLNGMSFYVCANCKNVYAKQEEEK